MFAAAVTQSHPPPTDRLDKGQIQREVLTQKPIVVVFHRFTSDGTNIGLLSEEIFMYMQTRYSFHLNECGQIGLALYIRSFSD